MKRYSILLVCGFLVVGTVYSIDWFKKAGKKVEEGVEKAGKKVKEAGKKVVEKGKKAAKKAGKTFEEAWKDLESCGQATKLVDEYVGYHVAKATLKATQKTLDASKTFSGGTVKVAGHALQVPAKIQQYISVNYLKLEVKDAAASLTFRGKVVGKTVNETVKIDAAKVLITEPKQLVQKIIKAAAQ